MHALQKSCVYLSAGFHGRGLRREKSVFSHVTAISHAAGIQQGGHPRNRTVVVWVAVGHHFTPYLSQSRSRYRTLYVHSLSAIDLGEQKRTIQQYRNTVCLHASAALSALLQRHAFLPVSSIVLHPVPRTDSRRYKHDEAATK